MASSEDRGGRRAPREFQLARFFAKNQFNVKHLLCASDCESLSMSELVSMMSDSTLQLWNNLGLGYTKTEGHPLLRKAVAAMYACDQITENNVLVMDSNEAIYVAMRSFVKSGDRVICTWPGYQSLSEIALAQGAQVDHWEVEEGDDGFFFDVDKLEQLLVQPCQCVIVNFPHNPTGALPSHADWERIVRLVSRQGAVLFCDEVYRGLEYDSGDRLSSACTAYARGVTVSGVSKSFGMPGVRIGWLITQDVSLLGGCATYRDYCSMCASAPSEILALAGLENRDTILSRNRTLIAKSAAALQEMLQKPGIAEHFKFVRPKGGSVALIALKEGTSASEFCKRLVEQYGVLLSSTSLFEWKDQYLRIGFGRLSGVENIGAWEKAILDGCVPNAQQ